MQEKNKEVSKTKVSLHPRNRHQGRYDLNRLIDVHPELGSFVHKNVHGNQSIDFFDPKAVKALNKALLMQHYAMEFWDVPAGYLCPPIPGRADYIHHMADLLAASHDGVVPKGTRIRCLDIGVGASCVYPIIGRKEYDWTFICSEIDPKAMESAKHIVDSNELLSGKVYCRLQTRPKDIFHGIIRKEELIDLVFCNPPFHASEAEARAGSMRKLRNLKGERVSTPVLNFGGQSNELWTEGGERGFILHMIEESKQFAKSCFWYSALVSKESNVKPILKALAKARAREHKVIPMGQGNKVSRIVTWTFLKPEEQESWKSQLGSSEA